ncbi:ribose-phosphate diphosphokinase [Achromobacter xylosoxidans]
MSDFSRIELLYTDSEGQAFNHAIRFLGFPGGERHVWISEGVKGEGRTYTIDARIYSSDAVMDLLLLNDALRRAVGEDADVTLRVPYLPYARQDRVTVEGEPLSVKVFCTLINAMKVDRVVVADPHSTVGPALLDRLEIESAETFLSQLLALPEFSGGVALVAPDAGAHKRVQAMGEKFGLPVVFCAKVRDTATGRLGGARVLDEVPNLPLLVVDDICDGGGTFAALAPVLRQHSRKPISLYVTHGLCTKGLAPLKDYDRLFTAYPRDTSLWTRRGGVFQAFDATQLPVAA